MGKYKVVFLAVLVLAASVLLGKTVGLQQLNEVKGLSEELTSLREAGFDNADELESILQKRNIELSNLRAENEALETEIAELEGDYLRELNRYPKYSRSEALAIITKIAAANNCSLKYFYILEAPDEVTEGTNDIEGKYSFRLVGTLDNIIKVLETLNEETLQYSVGALSVKKDSSEGFLSSPQDGISLFQWIEEVAQTQNSGTHYPSGVDTTLGASQQPSTTGVVTNPSGGLQLGPTMPKPEVIKLSELFTTTNYILDLAIKL